MCIRPFVSSENFYRTCNIRFRKKHEASKDEVLSFITFSVSFRCDLEHAFYSHSFTTPFHLFLTIDLYISICVNSVWKMMLIKSEKIFSLLLNFMHINLPLFSFKKVQQRYFIFVLFFYVLLKITKFNWQHGRVFQGSD